MPDAKRTSLQWLARWLRWREQKRRCRGHWWWTWKAGELRLYDPRGRERTIYGDDAERGFAALGRVPLDDPGEQATERLWRAQDERDFAILMCSPAGIDAVRRCLEAMESEAGQ